VFFASCVVHIHLIASKDLDMIGFTGLANICFSAYLTLDH
jgi:hypothetical protein